MSIECKWKVGGYIANAIFIIQCIVGFAFWERLSSFNHFLHGLFSGILFLGLLIYTIDECDNYRNKKRSKGN